MKQTTFASLAWNGKGKDHAARAVPGRDGCGDSVVAAGRLIEPHYPKAGQGRQPLGLEKMLRIYFLQQWFNLSDPQAEDAIYDSESMRRFARVELGDEVVPDETHDSALSPPAGAARADPGDLCRVAGLLEERRLLLRSGTIVDATIIAAPSSTKNASARRDPEMKQTRKGRNWHFGMKLHIGADKRGIVHTVRATAASVADITQLPDLLHGQEREVFGDQAYWKEDDREFLEPGDALPDQSASHQRPLSRRWRMINRARSRTRARGEHAFRVVKQLWGFAKVRYRGLAKNTARLFAVFALANLYLVRRRLMPPGDVSLLSSTPSDPRRRGTRRDIAVRNVGFRGPNREAHCHHDHALSLIVLAIASTSELP